MNESDLRDLLSLDAVELGFMIIGQFMLAGAGWLFVEKYLEAGTTFAWTPLTAFCAAGMFFGAVMLGAGLVMRFMKRNRIRRIFNETDNPRA